MNDAPPRLWVITGLMAAGKSTVAQALAERLPKSVHVRGDLFRRMIVNGREEMSASPTPGALAQLALRYATACQVALAYAEAGFSVVYQDIILGEHLRSVVKSLAAHRPEVVVLAPNLDVIARREAERPKTGYTPELTPQILARGLDETPRIGRWIDTSAMTVAETVEAILSSGPAPAAGRLR